MSESLSQYVVHFSAPLYTQNGEISGVIATRFPVSKLNDIFRTPVTGVENVNPIRLDLIANNGLVIYSDHDRKSMLHDNLSDLAIFKTLTNNSRTDDIDKRRSSSHNRVH